MPTLLVNPKMDPALVARVHASVTGRRRQLVKVRSSARIVSALRLLVVALVLGLVGSVLLSRHRERIAFQRAQLALTVEWRTAASSLTETDLGFLELISALTSSEARDFSGDVIAPELRRDGGLDALLSRPAVYVRGPTSGFMAFTGITKLASESGKDAFLLCLLEPPAERAEKAMLPKARLALSAGQPVQALTPNIRRLADAVVGLPYLLPGWGDRIGQAKDQATLQRLDRDFKRAPLDAAKLAVKAELLVAILDEPNDAGGVTELDGEHAHSVRVAFIDVQSGKPLLRLRKQVDPSWVTPNRRSQYARELDSCKLALEVRDSVGP